LVDLEIHELFSGAVDDLANSCRQIVAQFDKGYLMPIRAIWQKQDDLRKRQ